MSECLELDLNEMPYPPADTVVEAARMGLESLNRYAEPAALDQLTRVLADYAGVEKEHLLLGPGSDLLLREIVMCFAAGRKVVMASPSFLPTVQVARRFAGRLVRIRLSPPDFALAREPLLEELTGPCLVIIDNPNNPTGRLVLDRDTAREVLERPETLLVVDEAYFEFSGLTFAGLVSDYGNLALSRTLDKAFSLAGARVGYLIAGQTFLDAFPGSATFLPRPSLLAAIEALREPGYMWRNVELVMRERERLREQLESLGALVYPSSSNFLLLRSRIPTLAEALREQGILVLDLSSQLGPGYLRVAVGTPEQDDAFVRAYQVAARSEGA
ncbi:MAG: aminotransferase class I/II-fold pyridoxal phosphate-dependent enzyme [Spirochaetales bacterium]|nr:aminotransferase class I/II-fold pyridoxal phosphate-dependent enzyme [Spirochaetales bacterium]